METSVAQGVVCGHCGAPQEPGEAVCSHCGVALRTLLCPHCAARMPEGAAHCHGCGRALESQALPPLPADRACPRCGGELGVRTLGEASAIECGACHGLWLEPHQMERMLREAAASSAPLPQGEALPAVPLRYIPCVRCGELMQRRQFRWGGRATHLVLDHCKDHGVWFDGQELAAALSIASQRGPESASQGDLSPDVLSVFAALFA